MREWLKPGAYLEWRDAAAGRLSPLRTDIAAFVGIARRGPLDTPVPVESFRQFEAHFGGFSGGGYLAYAVRGFFDNGGRRCWVVRVAARGRARRARVDLRDAAGDVVWSLTASSPGRWGDALSVAVTEVYPAQTVAGPPWASDRFATVQSAAGFGRGDLVRLQQPGGGAPDWRVVSQVDAGARRLYWMHPEPGAGLPYDRPFRPVDPAAVVHVASLAYALSVRLANRPIAVETELTLVPQHARYGPRILRAPDAALAPESERVLPVVAPPVVIETPEEVSRRPRAPRPVPTPLAIVRGATLPLAGGSEGLALLRAEDFLGEEAAPGDRDEVKRAKRRGLHALDVVDEVALIAVPDILIQPLAEPVYVTPETPAPNVCVPCPPPPSPAVVHQPSGPDELPPVFSDEDVYRVHAALVELCEARRDRFALLDPPAHMVHDGARGLAELQAWRTRFDTRHAALYHPWLRVTDPLGLAPTRLVPACGHVAGQFAFHDVEIGVHRAAANRVLGWIQDVGAFVDDGVHGELNRLGVNVIRAELGRGLRILGARTLSSDPDWRYINVRRLVMMVIRALDLGTQWVAFEPNDDETRAQVTQVLSEFLAGLWRDGALVGAVPEEAFYVRCDEANNPPESRDLGRLIAEVGLAPSVPCEFVVLRVGREANAFELSELGVGAPV